MDSEGRSFSKQGNKSGQFHEDHGTWTASGIITLSDPLNSLGNGVTYAFWIKADSAKETGQAVMTWDDSIDSKPFNFYITPGSGSTRNLRYYAGDASGLSIVEAEFRSAGRRLKLLHPYGMPGGGIT